LALRTLRRDRDPLDLARPRRLVLRLEGAPVRGGEARAQLQDVGLNTRADVEDSTNAPALVRSQEGVDHIPHVHVVAALAAVAEDARLLAPAEGVAEDRDHARLAVGVLARAVDVAEAKRRPRHHPGPAIQPDVALRRELALAVRRLGQAGRRLIEGELRRRAL